MISKYIPICGIKYGTLHVDVETGHIYSIVGAGCTVKCVAKSLYFLTKYARDDRKCSKMLAQCFHDAQALVKQRKDLTYRYSSCQYRQSEKGHNHPPPHRLLYLLALFRWDCRLRALEATSPNFRDILRSAIKDWPFVFPMETSTIYEKFKRGLKDFIALDRKSSTVVKFLKNHNRSKYDNFCEFLKSKQKFWSPPCLADHGNFFFPITYHIGSFLFDLIIFPCFHSVRC